MGGRGGRGGGAGPQSVVGAGGAGLKGQQEGLWGGAGAAARPRGPGVGARGPPGLICSPPGPRSKATASNSPEEGRGPSSELPAKPRPPPPATSGPTRTHLAPAAPSGTAPPRWAAGGAGAGTQRGPALPLQDWVLRETLPSHWLYWLPQRKKPRLVRQ